MTMFGVIALFLLQLAGPQSGPSPFRVEKLVVGVDSFVMRMQGRDFGGQRFTVERTKDGFVFTETTVTGGGGQNTRVEIDANGAMRSVKQNGAARGVKTEIIVEYAGGRVKGSSLVPPATEAVAIDMEVPAGVVDDNAYFSLLPTLPWKKDASWTLDIFSAGKNALEQRVLAVAGIDTVEVPAGTFEAYRGEMEAGGRIVMFHVTTAEPHRIVKVSIQGVPMEFVRAR